MLRWLDTLTRDEAPRVGAKAARMGELAAAGLPVPPGFVVPAEAYHAAVAAHAPLGAALERVRAAGRALEAGALDQAIAEVLPAFMRMPLPPDLEAALASALAQLGEGPVAVRSSAPGEDGAGASFAGQQSTFLNAEGPEQVLRCLRACWAGAWAPGVTAYRQRLAASGQDDGGPPAMAVIVQRLVVPEVAGVAFTADPLTGERDRLVIDAAYGLGEGVVSGATTPDRAVVARLDGALLGYELGSKHLAIVPGPHGTQALPVPAARQAARALTPPMLDALRALADVVEARFAGPQDLEWAWADGALHLLQARPITALPPAPPPGGWLPAGLEAGARLERRNFAEHFPGPLSPLAETLLLPAVAAALDRLASSLGLRLPDPGLTTVHGWAYARSDMKPQAAVAWRAPALYARLLLTDPATWEQGEPHARRVARMLAARPEEPALLVAWAEGLVAAFAATWADVHRLSAGWRWSEYAVRRLTGRPDLMGALLAVGAGGPADGPTSAGAHPASFDPAVPLPPVAPPFTCGTPQARDAARQAALAELVPSLPGWKRALLARLLPWAQRFAAMREPALLTLGQGWGGLREGLLALGAALAARGQLEAAEDVFWLPWRTVCRLAEGGGSAEVGAAAAARAEHATRLGYAPPLSIGGPPERLPAGAIVGIPASGGQVTGRVRVVRGPEDFDTFLAGEVLVAPTTTPAWTPLFGRAAAIVTDVGGPLSHGSIVAREFGIPAVLGTEAASRRLTTGQLVTVDGDQGVVWPAR